MTRHLTTARDEWPALRWRSGRRWRRLDAPVVLVGADHRGRRVTVWWWPGAAPGGWNAQPSRSMDGREVWARTLRGVLRALRYSGAGR